MTDRFFARYSRRVKATVAHLLVSFLIAGLAALVVFAIWYPYPYRIISGGKSIFLILVSVDVILGPLLTAVVATKTKPGKTLAIDLLFIALLQIAALLYGMSTVFEARPVHVVFERDRFQVVHAVDIPQNELEMTPSGIEASPLTGPTLLSLRPFRDTKEEMELTFQSAVGITLAAQPSMWIPFDKGTQDVLAKAKTIATLRKLFPARAEQIDSAVMNSNLPESQLAYLPLVSRQAFWTVLIDTKTAKPVAYIDLDPYEVTAVK